MATFAVVRGQGSPHAHRPPKVPTTIPARDEIVQVSDGSRCAGAGTTRAGAGASCRLSAAHRSSRAPHARARSRQQKYRDRQVSHHSSLYGIPRRWRMSNHGSQHSRTANDLGLWGPTGQLCVELLTCSPLCQCRLWLQIEGIVLSDYPRERVTTPCRVLGSGLFAPSPRQLFWLTS